MKSAFTNHHVGLDWIGRPRGETLAAFVDHYPAQNGWSRGKDPLWIRLMDRVFADPSCINPDTVRAKAFPLRKARMELVEARRQRDVETTRAEELERVALEQLDAMTDKQVTRLNSVGTGLNAFSAKCTVKELWLAMCAARKIPDAVELCVNESDLRAAVSALIAVKDSTRDEE